MFMLLLAFASVLGFVFQSDPGTQRQLLDSTLERMSGLLIAAELILIAELNLVLARRLWPRSRTGELVKADRKAVARLGARVVENDRHRTTIRTRPFIGSFTAVSTPPPGRRGTSAPDL